MRIKTTLFIVIVLLLPFTALQAQESNPYTFAAGGAVSLTTAGGAGTTVTGYARVQPAAGADSPSGFAIFGLRQNNILVTESAVPSATPVRSGRIYAEIVDAVNTGLALANPNNEAATINFYFTDSNGQNVFQGTTTVAANGQMAKFLDQDPFRGRGPLRGTFTFNSSVPVSAVALRGLTNQRGEFLITTLPVADLSATTIQPLNFPHYADGAGWRTELMLVNPTDSPITGSIRFFGDIAVAAFPDSISQQREFRVYEYSIPPRSSRRLVTGGVGSLPNSSWAQVSPSGTSVTPVGLAVFAYRQGNTVVSEAGVPAIAAGTAFRVYAETEGNFNAGQVGSMQTGFAIANLGFAPATVDFELTTLEGQSTGLSGNLVVQPNSQTAKFLNQIQGFATLPASFRGVLRISNASNAPLSVIGLRARYNERQDLLIATLPPVNESVAPSRSELIFPHLADAGGYTSQFVLLGASRSQAASGTIRFVAPSGSPLTLLTKNPKELTATGTTNAEGRVTIRAGSDSLTFQFKDEITGQAINGLSVSYVGQSDARQAVLTVLDPSDKYPLRFIILNQRASSTSGSSGLDGNKPLRMGREGEDPVPVSINNTVYSHPLTDLTLEQLPGVVNATKGVVDNVAAVAGIGLRVLEQSGVPIGKYANKLSTPEVREFTHEEYLARLNDNYRSGLKNKLMVFTSGAAIAAAATGAVALEFAGIATGVAIDTATLGFNWVGVYACSLPNQRIVESTYRLGGVDALILITCKNATWEPPQQAPFSFDGMGPCSGTLGLVHAGDLGLAYAARFENGRGNTRVRPGSYKANVHCDGMQPVSIDVPVPPGGATVQVPRLQPPVVQPPPPPPPPATVASVRLRPDSLTGFLEPGTTVQYTATPLDAAGNVVPGVTCTFEISNPVAGNLVVATINPATGLLTVGNQQGAASVFAVCNGVRSLPSLVSGRGGPQPPPPPPPPPAAIMTVAPLALSFAATEGSAAPGAQTITVRNTGPAGTTLTYTGTKSGSWLTASGNVSQPLASGQSAAFTVTVNHAGLAPGTYTGSVNFAATSITSTATVAVTLVVSPRQTPPQGSGLTGTWRGTWTRRPNGFCDVFTNDITWNLVQNGNNVTGTYTHTVTVAQPDQEWCPNNVGHRTTGTFAQGTISSNTLTIFLEGGTRFVGTFDSTTITGTTPGSGIGTGSFTVRKQ